MQWTSLNFKKLIITSKKNHNNILNSYYKLIDKLKRTFISGKVYLNCQMITLSIIIKQIAQNIHSGGLNRDLLPLQGLYLSIQTSGRKTVGLAVLKTKLECSNPV